MGMGTLYISEARVSWVGIQGKVNDLHETTEKKDVELQYYCQGFSLEYKHVALHAVSRDLTQFHQECLYLMIGEDKDNLLKGLLVDKWVGFK